MITKIKENDNIAYGLCQFIVAVHSMALSISGRYFILTGERKWVQLGGN